MRHDVSVIHWWTLHYISKNMKLFIHALIWPEVQETNALFSTMTIIQALFLFPLLHYRHLFSTLLFLPLHYCYWGSTRLFPLVHYHHPGSALLFPLLCYCYSSSTRLYFPLHYCNLGSTLPFLSLHYCHPVSIPLFCPFDCCHITSTLLFRPLDCCHPDLILTYVPTTNYLHSVNSDFCLQIRPFMTRCVLVLQILEMEYS